MGDYQVVRTRSVLCSLLVLLIMNRSYYGSQNISMDENGNFHVKVRVSSSTSVKSVAKTVKNTVQTADLSINKAFVPHEPNAMAVNIAVVVFLTMATVALKRSKGAGHDTELEDFPSRTEATPVTSAVRVSTKVLKVKPLENAAPEAIPIRHFNWPIHMALKDIYNFSEEEMETIIRLNSPQITPKKAASKKKLHWSPCVEVYEVRKLGETACLEWDDESESLWWDDPLTGTHDASKGPPELALQRFRLRRRVYQ